MFEDSFLSQEAARLHTDGHYLKYCQNLIKLGHKPENALEIARSKPDTNIYNNAAQIFNHEFFAKSMAKDQNNPDLLDFLNRKCDFINVFQEKAMELFGSGWTWLTYRDDGQYVILNTKDADLPDLSHKLLLVLDMWEHSFYYDFPAKKSIYIKTFLNNGINWKFLENNIKSYNY